MSVGIVFYSFSGATRAVCRFLEAALKRRKTEAELIELALIQEERSFLRQSRDAFRRVKPELRPAVSDLSRYGYVVFASPVWAFTFAPALRSYLENVSGLAAKEAACLLTCGAPCTSGKALTELEEFVRSKGARVTFSSYLYGAKASNGRYVAERLAGLLETMDTKG